MGAFTKVALALLVCLIVGVSLARREAAHYLSSVLANAHESEMVVIGRTAYRVTDGIVYQNDSIVGGDAQLPALELAYRKLIAERTPILGLAGTDPAALEDATRALASSSAALAALQTSSASAHAAQESLYPIDFLHALGELERARLVFVASGDAQDADAYDQALIRALDLYRTDLANFSHAFRTFVPNTAPPYATERLILTRSDALALLESAMAGARSARSRERARSLCVAGIPLFCNAGDLALTTGGPAHGAGVPTDLSSRVVALFRSAGSIGTSTVPKVELETSDCVRPDKAPIFYLDEGARPLERFFYIGDLRFVRTAEQHATPLYVDFAAHGMTYAPTQPTSYYECVQGASDLARTGATLATARFAAQERVSQFATGTAQSELTALEKSLNAPTVRETDALAYLAHANALPPAGIPASTTRELAELVVSFRDRSADFDTFVVSIAAGEQLNIKRASRGGQRANDIATLLYTRSAFASLFLLQNPSIVPQPTSIRDNTTARSDEPFVWLSQLPVSMDVALIHDVALFRDLSQS